MHLVDFLRTKYTPRHTPQAGTRARSLIPPPALAAQRVRGGLVWLY